MTVITVLCVILCVISLVQSCLLWKLWQTRGGNGTEQKLDALRTALDAQQAQGERHFDRMAGLLRQEQREAFDAQETKLTLLGEQTARHLAEERRELDALSRHTEERMRSFSQENSEKLTAMRMTVQQNLQMMQKEQSTQLDEMRKVVDEKMQRVLSERMQQAFSSVSDRLEQVHKGLGEMQTLAGNVGDLKRLLTNVKTRGEIGEIQLEALLSDLLSPGQYRTNVKIGRGIVEFAVRMPDQNGGECLLPIDAKFAGDTYLHLQEAYDAGDPAAIREAQKNLITRIRKEAQDIAEKYLLPPATTDFGILFLPTEGLYMEAVRAGLPEEIFRKFRIFVTGPTTLSAMLSTLRMGLQSIAVQKYSGEVWNLLGEVRTEFSTFADALSKTQSKLQSASDELEKLVGVRTRQMQKKLSSVQEHLDMTQADSDHFS